MLYLDDMEYHFSKMVLKKIEELENNPEYNPENIDKSELPELKKQLKQHIKEIKAQYKIF